MKDVADVLARYVGADNLQACLHDLEMAGYDNTLWREFVRRIRRAAGLATASPDTGPKELLTLMEKEADR